MTVARRRLIDRDRRRRTGDGAGPTLALLAEGLAAAGSPACPTSGSASSSPAPTRRSTAGCGRR